MATWQMIRRGLAAVLVSICLLPTAAPAAEPVVVMSLKSFDELIRDSKYLAELMELPVVGSLPQMIDQMTGGKGLQGLDSTKPIGSYMFAPRADEAPRAVFFFPMSNARQFEETLSLVLSKPQKEDGVLRYDMATAPLFGKGVGTYYFLTESAELLKETHDPLKLVKAKDDLAIEINIPQLMKDHRQEIENKLAEAVAEAKVARLNRNLSDDEKLSQERFEQFAEKFMRVLTEEMDRVTVGVNIDEAGKNISFDVSVTAKPGTDFAATLDGWSKNESPFTGLLSSKTIASWFYSGTIEPLVRDEILSGMKQLDDELIRELTDRRNLSDQVRAALRPLDERFLEVIRKTIQRGRLDIAVVANNAGPDSIDLVAMAKVADGKELSKILEERAKIDPEWAKGQSLGVAVVNGERVHRFEIERTPELDLGTAHWGVINDTIVIAVGRDSLALLKSSIDAKPVKTDSAMFLDVDVMRLLMIFENKIGQGFPEFIQGAVANGPARVSLRFVATPNDARYQLKFDEQFVRLASKGVRTFFDGLKWFGELNAALRRVVDDDPDAAAVSWNAKPGTQLRYRVKTNERKVGPTEKDDLTREAETTILLTVASRQDDSIQVVADIEQYSFNGQTPSGESLDVNVDRSSSSSKQSSNLLPLPFSAKDLATSAKRMVQEPLLLKISLDGMTIAQYARSSQKRTAADAQAESDINDALRTLIVAVDRREIVIDGSWTTTETVGSIKMVNRSTIRRINDDDEKTVAIHADGFAGELPKKPGEPAFDMQRNGDYQFLASRRYLKELTQKDAWFSVLNGKVTTRNVDSKVELLKADSIAPPIAKFVMLDDSKLTVIVEREQGDRTEPLQVPDDRPDFTVSKPAQQTATNSGSKNTPTRKPGLLPDTRPSIGPPRRAGEQGRASARPSMQQAPSSSARKGSSSRLAPSQSNPRSTMPPKSSDRPSFQQPLRDRFSARPAKSYPMRSAIPADSEKVATMTLIPKGTKMQIEWGGRWQPVTALQDSSEGPIQIRWDNYGNSWDEPVNRESIIIEKKTQADLSKSKTDKP